MVRTRWIVSVAVLPWVVAAASCGKGGPPADRLAALDTAKWYGMYVSDTLSSASGRGRLVRLAVGPDTAAALAIEFVGLGTTYHPGRWSAEGDLITLQPTRGDGTPTENALTWRLEGKRLVPAKWDKSVYGATGLPLVKSAPPVAAPSDSNAGAVR